MDSTAIKEIVELARPNIIAEHGYVYSDKSLNVINEPQVKTIRLSTLKSLVELLKKECDEFTSPIIIHVEGPCSVTVHTGVSEADRQREIPYCVSPDIPVISFDRKMEYENMMIGLKSKFVETPELKELVRLLGTITEENNMQIADDGFTQTVTVRKGIAIKGNKAVNPIVKLKPYRTFLEIDQPESEFLVRLFEGGYVALFEADGGAWKLNARNAIQDYLSKSLSELIESGTVIITA